MADDMKRVGLVFKADGAADFKKSLQQVSTAAKENYSELKLAQSQYDKNTTATQKLQDRQKYLTQQTELYSDKLSILNRELEEMEADENTSKEALEKKKTQINNTQAQLNKYKSELEEVNKDLKNGTSQMKEYAEKLDSMGDKMESAGKKMSVVSGAIVAAGTAAVTTAASFDSSMSQVQATMGITKDETSKLNGQTVNTMDALSDLAQQMGESTAFSATECAEAMNYLALAGFSTQQIYDTLPLTLNLAAAGGMDLASTSEMLTGAMYALGLTTDDTEALVDQMAKTASSTGTSVEELGEGISTIGATARTVKGGTAELNTALGILANNNIKGAEGGTHLRNVILSLQSPTDTAAECMEDLGLSAYDSEGNMRSLNDILSDLNASMDGMTSEEKNNIISTIFNKTDLSSVNALLANTGDTWDDLQGKITDSGGSAQQMADTQLDNLEGKLTLLKSAVEALEIAFGQTLMPAIEKATDTVQGWVDELNGMDEGTRSTVVTIALLIAAIGPLLIIGGSLAKGISNIISLGSILIPIITGISAPMWIAIAVIAALIGVGVLLYQNWDTIKEKAGALKEEVQQAWNNLKQGTKDAWNNMKTNISESASTAKANVVSKWNDLKTNTSEAWENIKTSISDKASTALDNATSKFSDIKSNISEKMDGAREAVDGAIEKIKGIMDFSWSLPELKMPHISTKGKFSLNPISVPTFSIDWYAKGGILNSPTIFGASGKSLLGGGEAGKEAVAPIDTLLGYIRQANAEQTAQMEEIFGNAMYRAMIKVMRETKPEVVLNDEKVGELFATYLRKELFA